MSGQFGTFPSWQYGLIRIHVVLPLSRVAMDLLICLRCAGTTKLIDLREAQPSTLLLPQPFAA